MRIVKPTINEIRERHGVPESVAIATRPGAWGVIARLSCERVAVSQQYSEEVAIATAWSALRADLAARSAMGASL